MIARPFPGPVWAVVVAGGNGTRFGSKKQYARLGDRPVVAWALDSARQATDGVVLVVPSDDVGLAIAWDADVVVAGGVRRSDSVRAGLDAVPLDVAVIVVHDAARPFATPAVWAAVIAAIRDGADAAVPTVAVTDTIKSIAPGGALVTLDRSTLVAVQTPQAFDGGALRLAHALGPDATDDAALVEAQGGRVALVPGDPHNLKITHPDDLLVAAALLPMITREPQR